MKGVKWHEREIYREGYLEEFGVSRYHDRLMVVVIDFDKEKTSAILRAEITAPSNNQNRKIIVYSDKRDYKAHRNLIKKMMGRMREEERKLEKIVVNT